MITAAHRDGQVIISTDDYDEFGEKRRTHGYITMEDAQRLHKEICEALAACREYMVGLKLEGSEDYAEIAFCFFCWLFACPFVGIYKIAPRKPRLPGGMALYFLQGMMTLLKARNSA